MAMTFDPLGKAENHPEFVAMLAAVSLPGSVALCVKAVDEGRPALAGVDAMLSELFVRYRACEAYVLADGGFIVTRVMRLNGYKVICSGPMPDGCSAKSGNRFALVSL